MKPNASPDPTLRRTYWMVFGAGLALSLGAALIRPERPSRWADAASVLLGAVLALANLAAISAVVGRMLSGVQLRFGALAFLKLFGLFGLVYLLLTQPYVRGFALAIGFAALPLGIVLSSLLFPGTRTSDWEVSSSDRAAR